MQQEEWRDVEGYEGKYQVSNWGNVRSLNYNNMGFANNLKPNDKITGGYLCVYLRKNNKTKQYKIHRLVAETFIPNFENKLCVNHIDGNKLNNNVDNLEWCTSSENNKHAYRCGLKKGTWLNKRGIQHPTSKSVAQYDKNGEFIKKYESITEASNETKIIKKAICNCLRKKSKTSGGYIWRYI